MRKLRKNQSGFSPLYIILLILLIILLIMLWWWIKNKQSSNNNSASSSSQTSEKSESKNQPEESTVKYLEIKEWGLKMPLGDDITGAYYMVRQSEQGDPAEYIDIYDSGFDNTTNKNGVKCKDENFPLFVIGRVKSADIEQVMEPDKLGYKKLDISETYLFNGSEAHQSYPMCANLTPDGDFSEDNTVLGVLETKQTAITAAYSKIAKL